MPSLTYRQLKYNALTTMVVVDVIQRLKIILRVSSSGSSALTIARYRSFKQ